jgi:hypothetical protein
MNKDVLAPTGGCNEAKTLVPVEKFDGADLAHGRALTRGESLANCRRCNVLADLKVLG